jgi:hypothetical protein
MDGTNIGEWSDKVEDLLVQCEHQATDPARVLADLHGLLETGPVHICGPVKPGMSRSTLQGLLESGATESAALRLVSRCAYMLSRGGEGVIIASVLTPNADRDYSFSAASEAAALSGALATCLHECVMAEGQTDRSNPRQSQS